MTAVGWRSGRALWLPVAAFVVGTTMPSGIEPLPEPLKMAASAFHANSCATLVSSVLSMAGSSISSSSVTGQIAVSLSSWVVRSPNVGLLALYCCASPFQ